jgi:DNA-binding transcriptional ArsR family regulator
MSTELLDATFAALADPTRRAILARLRSGEATVTELAEPFAMSQPAISKHLKVLERAGLATECLEKYRGYWEESFQRLDDLLDELKKDEGP